jgi:aconitate hydratase
MEMAKTGKMTRDPFGAQAELQTDNGTATIYRLERLEELGLGSLARMPYSIRVMLETVLRQFDGFAITEQDVTRLAGWNADNPVAHELPYKPARVLLQDFTGVPAVVDLAALRSAMGRLGSDPARINPIIPVDLVIDHSVQVDRFGSLFALFYNAEREFERNRERYEFLRWGQSALDNFRVVPPATGIVHQVNLEYLARVVQTSTRDGQTVAFPDTLVGTDSHTTMINGLGVVGWGVGGIEAEAVMLGQPIYMLTPQVVGFRLTGALPEGATATDLVLTVTQMLRAKGVVGKFVEFYGPGVSRLSLADRATIANMAPEYGATIGFFPVDDVTLGYLRGTGREPGLVDLVERYTKEQGLFRTDEAPEPAYNDGLALDLAEVTPSLAGPKRPQDRVPLGEMKRSFQDTLQGSFGRPVPQDDGLADGAVVIAAITSCTNTSNPSVMVAAGLLARKAVELGVKVPCTVKTSLAPGSKVVTRYLQNLGLMPYLQALGFHVVGYGCTSCIGNSGPLPDPVAAAVRDGDLVVASVLSGNRNFEGRVHPLTKINYLASPPLVVAYALAGSVNVDLVHEPLSYDPNGQPVYLRDVWPSQEEIRQAVQQALSPELFEAEYSDVFRGDENWNQIAVPEGDLYAWDPASTYVQEPPFFMDLGLEVPSVKPVQGARVLALLGDSVTTDHISPAGTIPLHSPAGQYLIAHGVDQRDFNSFGSRRGNHEVMMRGTFGNIRLRNQLLPGSEGGVTRHLPSGDEMTIYDAAMRYQAERVPLIVIAGREYGTGSSRDWAAKGPSLLGVVAVIAESYERIHRSNLVGMGILPLQFRPGEGAASLVLTGREVYDIEGIGDDLQPGQSVTVRARREDGSAAVFDTRVRIDSPVEVEYYRNGGVLHTVLREMVRAG